jgi:gp62 family protein
MARKGSPRRTGPSQETRRVVYERDQYRCARCGRHAGNGPMSIQHRRARGMGGSKSPNTNSPSNLILLCGDGVRGCHGHIEQNRSEARKAGYNIPQFVDNPEAIPVQYWDGRTYLLKDDGSRECLG